MKFYQESGAIMYGNHTYLLDDSKTKVYGYVKEGTKNLEMFKVPKSFSTKGRILKVIKETFGYVEKKESSRIEVSGSKGNKYYIEKNGNKFTCTCPGFTYRNTCKHILQFSGTSA